MGQIKQFSICNNSFWLLCTIISITTILTLSEPVVGQIKMKKGAPHIFLSNPKQLLRGTILNSRDDRPYYSFRGIRYAKTPKRFQLAEPLEESTTNEIVHDAFKFGSSCARWARLWKKFSGSEDCLFLNVYVPMKDVAESLPLPVMLYIHGGAFIDGESDTLGADYFMDENIVLVTINYRLGALGFLSTGDSVVPGNMGLHDQSLAIKWVYDNIDQFGGDKNRIVIFGESAGAASVGLQLLYPPNKGLFHAAISQSGTVHCPWVIQSTQEAKNNLHELSKQVGCGESRNSSKELVKCLETKKWEDILDVQKKLGRWFPGAGIPFGPVVEVGNDKDKPAFLTQHPEYLMKAGKFINVPYMVGINEEEGHFIFSAVVLKHEKLTEELNNEWNRVAPDTFYYEKNLKDASNLDTVSTKLRKFYLGDKEINVDSRTELTNLYSDLFFNYGVQKTAKVVAGHNGKVFTYVFTYNGEFTLLKTWMGIDDLKVVTHADELQYLFKTSKYGPPKGLPPNSESERISRNMVNLWASFAANTKPKNTWGSATNWYPLSKGKDIFWYKLDSDTEILESFDKERHAFWDELIDEYYVDKSKLLNDEENNSESKIEL